MYDGVELKEVQRVNVNGATFDMTFISRYVAVAVNSKVIFYSLSNEDFLRPSFDLNTQILIYKIKSL